MRSAPGIKAAIRTQLLGASALAGVQVTYTAPAREAQFLPAASGGLELVFLGRVTNGTINWQAVGGQRMTETYDLGITVWTFKVGDDPVGTETRCGTILGGVIEALRQNPEVNHLTRQGITLSGGSLQTDPVSNEDPAGWLSVATLQVQVMATFVP